APHYVGRRPRRTSRPASRPPARRCRAPRRAPGTRPVPDQHPGLILWPPLAPRTVTAAPIHISKQGHGTWFTRHQHPPESRRPRHQPPPPSRAVKKAGERKGLTCIFILEIGRASCRERV